MDISRLDLQNRLLKGITYFKGIKPSEFNPGHYAHFKVFLTLVEEFINGQPVKKPVTVEEAKKIFEVQEKEPDSLS